MAALAAAEQRRALFRTPREEEEMRSMRAPVSTERAYALLGALLGAYPPAAIFSRLFRNYGFGYAFDSNWNAFILTFSFCLAMNLICFFVGRKMGAVLGRSMDKAERGSWSKLLMLAALMGCAWGAVTGAAGGALFFGIGAIFGVICAVPVGTAAFALFAPLHRSLARGGMIEAGHFWPLAVGITMMLVALILSPHVFSY